MITTMNRSDFLIRLLNYYATVGFKYCISIGDSSNAKHVEKAKKAINNLEGKLKIIYTEYPGLNDVECMKKVLESVSTPYAVNLADDDFLIPNSLEKCLIFLENNPSFSSAHGVGIVFNLHSSGAFGQFANIIINRLPSIEADTASNRISDYLENYCVNMFSLHRTGNWQAMIKDSSSFHDRSFGGELFPCCLSVIQGKVKQLDCFYLMRQNHDARSKLPSKDEWINSPNWNAAYNIFIDNLAEEISQKDDISFDEAKGIVKQAFDSYLNSQTKSIIYARIGKVARYVPGMNYLITHFKQKQFGDFSLSTLLNPSSPYHKDFMPVYNIITRQEKK